MRSFLAVFLAGFCQFCFATGLTIHTAEIGVGKFHRYDNHVHPYGENNAWTPFILPADADLTTPKIVENADKSVTVFFATLEELVTSLDKISKEKNQPIERFDINGHGLPGGMWYPADAATRSSFQCWDWEAAASADDEKNYDQYYTAVGKDDLAQIEQASRSGGDFGCVTGLKHWKKAIAKVPTLPTRFAPNAVISFLSCTVGMGPVGDEFTNGLAQLLLANAPQGKLKTIVQLGLGDWSLPEGLGFWYYQNDTQFAHDNEIYPVNRRDRDMMQKGSIRVSQNSGNHWTTGLVDNQDFLVFTGPVHAGLEPARAERFSHRGGTAPESVRIPGTNFRTRLISRH